jgi:hypothetical protein
VFVLTYLAGVGLELARGSVQAQAPSEIRLAGAVVFLIGAGIAAWGCEPFEKHARPQCQAKCPRTW